VRRLTSILTSLAVAAGAVAISSSVAHAAGGTVTLTRSATFSPSAVANAVPQRVLRLEKSNEFLAIGRNTSVAGSNFHIWKMKEDLTFNSTFGAVDLGADFAAPTSSNSACVASSNSGCVSVQSFSINEAADFFAAIVTRRLKGSGSSSSIDANIISVYVGKISTGAVVARAKFLDLTSSQMNAADWSSYGATELAKNICTNGNGATINGSPLTWAWSNLWNVPIRYDGALVVAADCSYSNGASLSQPTAVREYDGNVMTALKPSNGALVVDTSFATNGYHKLINSLTECGNNMPSSTSDTSITSGSSTKIFTVLQVSTFARRNTLPSGWSGQYYSSYEGCGVSSQPTDETPRITSFLANGTVKKSVTYPTGRNFYTNRWLIDSKGRWNTVVTPMGLNSPSSTPVLIRLLPDGSQDTSIGTAGVKDLAGLPSTLSVNGSSISMRYSATGIATTGSETLFVGFASSGTSNCTGNNPSGTYTSTAYPYYFSVENGLVSTYGTNGLGDSFAVTINNADVCNSTGSYGSVSYINSEGRPAVMRAVAAVGQQSAGLIYAVWDAASGVSGGGDGSISAGAAGRVDKKVYSTKLPAAAQADSALQVITAKQAEDLDIRTSTPKICVALTTSVLLVNPGRCVVRIIDEDTKKVLRTMTTTVKATDVDAGTTLTTDEPIYFKQANVKLSKTALAQVKELAAAAASASRIVVIGHSAALGEVSQYSYAISRNRAEAVKAALIKAGVKKPIEVVALAYNQPEKTAKTEAAQAKNRRAEVFIFP
jgi:outer membrane protein OmpA-like peptidoglycan-associated protein